MEIWPNSKVRAKKGESMSGTRAGGLKAAKTNKAKYGKDFYREMGRKGGKNGHTGGFAANPALAAIAGRKGGRKSRRNAVNRSVGEAMERFKLKKIAVILKNGKLHRA